MTPEDKLAGPRAIVLIVAILASYGAAALVALGVV
jgi:hypothetical protein